jgi:predicted ATPase
LTNLPVRHTPFIGYKVELAQIAARLKDPDCRLLTLLGPGGVGKTRLTVQAVQENAASFPGGSAFVPLARLRSANWIREAIACALDGALSRSAGPQVKACLDWRQALEALRSRTMVLILDHYEHLLPYTDPIDEILRAAPGVKLLTTSRQPLEVAGEWQLEIHGMAYPSQDGAPEAHTFDAVRLFAQSAARQQAKFTLSGETLPVVARICRMLQGNPLAVELAASWLESYIPSQIAAQIAGGLESLANLRPDLAGRQRGVRAVFDKTWEKLPAAEQATLGRAAVFQGGFDFQAARAILVAAQDRENGENLGERLANLVEKSLLLEQDGRFDLQPMLSQLAAERLEADGAEFAGTQQRHAEFFTGCLRILERESGDKQIRAACKLHKDLDNLRLAWEWALAHADAGAMVHGMAGLARFYELLNLPEEGEAAFQAAVTALQPRVAPEIPEDGNQALLAKLYTSLGHFQLQLGKSEAGQAALREASRLGHNTINY